MVLIVNTLAYITGYSHASLFRLDRADRKAVSMEVGIQNAGFGLILVITFFEGLGGMALICAWWGVWHFISGFLLAHIWSKDTEDVTESNLNILENA